MNSDYIEEYTSLDKKASPLFIEVKGYVFVGYSRKRMTISNMPTHNSIRNFGDELAKNLSYELTMERPDSRVVLLSKEVKTERFDK